MKIDVTKKLNGTDGQPLKDGGEELTLRKVCTNALLGVYDDERPTGEEKYKRWQLSNKVNISMTPEVELTPEEVTKIKELIGKAYGPMVVGPAYEILNG